MTLTTPFSLSFFNDVLPIAAVNMDVRRSDRISGQGSGRYWPSETAPPLWRATVELATRPSDEMKQYAAKIRGLHGVQYGFFLTDPLSRFPAADPRGALISGYSPKVESVPGHRSSLSIRDLPPAYKLTTADKFTINYGSNPTRYGFFEFTEDASSGSDGTTGLIGVYPHLPAGVVAGLTIRLVKPYFLAAIEPGSHNPGRARRHLTEGASFVAIQKLFA